MESGTNAEKHGAPSAATGPAAGAPRPVAGVPIPELSGLTERPSTLPFYGNYCGPPLHTSDHYFPESVVSVPEAGTLDGMIRVLVTLSPRMYRQAVALTIQRRRPGLVDVRIAPPETMEEQLASFRPHLLVHNEAGGDARDGSVPIPEEALRAVPHRIEVLYSDGMDALLSADGTITELSDASTEDLLAAVDRASEMADREEPSG